MSNIEEYINRNQDILDLWKDRFECLIDWQIRFVYDGEHWSHTKYSKAQRMAAVYPCDVDVEEDYLIHEIVKLSFIECDDDMNKKLNLISNLVAIIKREW